MCSGLQCSMSSAMTYESLHLLVEDKLVFLSELGPDWALPLHSSPARHIHSKAMRRSRMDWCTDASGSADHALRDILNYYASCSLMAHMHAINSAPSCI